MLAIWLKHIVNMAINLMKKILIDVGNIVYAGFAGQKTLELANEKKGPLMSFKPDKEKSPQENGRLYEAYLAELLGMKTVKGSGSLWYNKLDVEGNGLLISAKYTEKNSYALSAGVVQEAIAATTAVGGVGADTIPTLILGIDGEDLVVMRLSDLQGLLTDDTKIFEKSDKEKKRSLAKIPRLLRD